MLVSLASAGVIFAVGLFAFVQYTKRNSLFFPDVYPAGDWNTDTLPVKPQEVYFSSPDGTRLNGWYFDSGDNKAPVLIWFHGNAGNLSGRAPFASELARRGVSAFVFDYRGYGKSLGTPSESGVKTDALAAYDMVLKNFARDPRRIVFYGESIGGPFAAWAARNRSGCCVVIENSFPSLSRMADLIYGSPVGLVVRSSLTTTEWLNDAGLPVLVMHGERDATIPFGLGMELYNGLRTPKELLVSHGAGHCEIPAVEGERYYRTVVEFARSHSVTTSH
jgi:fermentation-respiration switch protein FrsA (DUF1100 family)